MKWLRSSLFKDNSDKFIFEEELDINIENFTPAISSIDNIKISGVLTRNGQDKIFVDLLITGTYNVYSSRTMNIISVPFDIEEREEFIDKSFLYGDEDYDVNVMDRFIDISHLVTELIILNAPLNYYLENEEIEYSSGKDWKLISDDYIEEKKKENPFSALSDMFKES
ncbi:MULTISPECIES: DUF177 domain-containing protein [unclassified Gemella]|uniref:YceD family protein n=1 Tax=unclassified Gemella TaxID=2624949 RepID=UPI001C03D622|nr:MULTISPECIES: YceD family protein [unclassified Gemella]MBU0278671.1 hypothetical protein [Gemella sp. zg-1178]QWQ39226.1 hypothetical protein KMP11_02550 [Gemella sp. zg-570]